MLAKGEWPRGIEWGIQGNVELSQRPRWPWTLP